MKKSPSKVVKAWAVIEDNKPLKFTYSYEGHQHYDIFPTRAEAKEWIKDFGSLVKIVPCTITYSLPTKKRRGDK